MRYYLDTEFYEDGRTIDLISIGIVAEDGREFYACSLSAEWSTIHREPWLVANVIPHLPPRSAPVWMTRTEIRVRLLAFIGEDSSPEFWAYYADYDWVALCQLFGRMIDLPKHFPMFCRDLKQLAVDKGNPPLPKQTIGEHDALADARWNRDTHAVLLLATTPEPAAPCIRCGATGVDMTDSGRCFDAYACWRHRPTVEPDEAERWASTQAERWLLDSAHGGMLSEDRGSVEALGHDHAHLATLLRAAEARGRERGLAEGEAIVSSAPTPDAVRRIRALRGKR